MPNLESLKQCGWIAIAKKTTFLYKYFKWEISAILKRCNNLPYHVNSVLNQICGEDDFQQPRFAHLLPPTSKTRKFRINIDKNCTHKDTSTQGRKQAEDKDIFVALQIIHWLDRSILLIWFSVKTQKPAHKLTNFIHDYIRYITRDTNIRKNIVSHTMSSTMAYNIHTIWS